MSTIQNKAAHVRAPIAAQAFQDSNGVEDKQYGVYTLTASTTSTAFRIPESWKDSYVTVLVSGSQRMQLAVTTGSVAPALTWNASNPPTASGSFARGATFLPDVSKDMVIPRKLSFRTSFSGTIGSAPTTFMMYVFENVLNATGSAEIYVSEGKSIG